MTRALLGGLVACALVVCACVSSAHAQGSDNEARGLYLAGAAAYDEGRYEDALAYFERSYKLSQRPGLLYNIGQAADRLRMDDRAIEAFEAYLEALPNQNNSRAVTLRVEALRKAVARREAREAAEAEQAPAEPVPTPEEAALASEAAPEPTESAPAGASQVDSDGDGIAKQWWFWTAIGAVAAGAAVGIVLATGGSDTTEASPAAPDTGVVIATLR